MKKIYYSFIGVPLIIIWFCITVYNIEISTVWWNLGYLPGVSLLIYGSRD